MKTIYDRAKQIMVAAINDVIWGQTNNTLWPKGKVPGIAPSAWVTKMGPNTLIAGLSMVAVASSYNIDGDIREIFCCRCWFFNISVAGDDSSMGTIALAISPAANP